MDISTALDWLDRAGHLEDVTLQGLVLNRGERLVVVDSAEDVERGHVPEKFLEFEDADVEEVLSQKLPMLAGGPLMYLSRFHCRAHVRKHGSSGEQTSARIVAPTDIRFADLENRDIETLELLPPEIWQNGALPLEAEVIRAGYQQEMRFIGRSECLLKDEEDSCFYLEHAEAPASENTILLWGQERLQWMLSCLPSDSEYIEGEGFRGSHIVVVRGRLERGQGRFEHQFSQLSRLTFAEEDRIHTVNFDPEYDGFKLACEN